MAHTGGVKVAQAVAALSKPGLKIDGIVGPATRAAVKALSPDIVSATNKVLSSAGVETLDTLMAMPVSASPDDFQKAVAAVGREAKKRGVNGSYYVALMALETGWGRSVPKLPNGQTSYNYAGLKYNSVKSQVKGKTDAKTLEYIKGAKTSVRDAFAVFNSPEDFARVFFWYLFDSSSGYRYPNLKKASSALEFGQILQKGGYATDPAYAAKIAAAANTAVARYGSVVNTVV